MRKVRCDDRFHGTSEFLFSSHSSPNKGPAGLIVVGFGSLKERHIRKSTRPGKGSTHIDNGNIASSELLPISLELVVKLVGDCKTTGTCIFRGMN